MAVELRAGTAVSVRERSTLVRFLWHPGAAFSVGFLALVVVAALAAPVLPLHNPIVEYYPHLFQGPGSASFPLGTDDLGRDLLSRMVYGARTTLLGVGEALAVFLALGVPLGLVSGFVGGALDSLVMWVADLSYSTPQIVVVLAILSIYSQNETAAMLAVGVLGSFGLTRIVRGSTIAVKNEQYVAAARVSGLSWGRITVRHVLPRIAGPIIVQASLFSSLALLFQTGLEFLGLATHPPAPSWGSMIAEAAQFIVRDPWMIVPPGAIIALTITALGLLGDRVRDVYAERWAPGGVVALGRTRERHQAAPAVVAPSRAAEEDPTSGEAAVRTPALLEVAGLAVVLESRRAEIPVVENVSFELEKRGALGMVGESGCGKTMTVSALLGLLPSGARRRAGSILFDGEALHHYGEKELSRTRGSKIGLISQEPVASLDPNFTVGSQVAEVVRRHRGLSRAEARSVTLELLDMVRLPDPSRVYRRYPHELSGGMAQRVAIAASLAGRPKLLVADEPTTALDVTTQAEIIALLRSLQDELGLSIILISHNWGLVANLCDRVVVMYAGQVVEMGTTVDVFTAPRHPYTAGLLASDPHLVSRADRLRALPGSVPEIGQWPEGCHFAPRCPYAIQACIDAPIAEQRVGAGHAVRCIQHERLVLERPA
ncbi:MAG: dipeptide/oligopeptide/nickel ABC transporter permease/ATP-binding protein [Actinomycetota bacterium]|nr:dipeptide/oligopeptide/nickel ABC transporter permease/ATP-binding protein [Actinomycetota bacterium]MDA8313190.1 dipeptide/oligopeptide/nickel ABC transporter permease/ATP-binding protein [Actinomycetota bacterium]MDA8316111.1 dipeptide/oligopeptide/nickel ABC transporter permease/ATP-binding protein [Actinomycetota bacterium]